MAAQEQLLKDLINMQTSEDWSEENGEIGEFDMDNFAPARSLDIVPVTHIDPSRCINSPSLDQVFKIFLETSNNKHTKHYICLSNFK